MLVYALKLPTTLLSCVNDILIFLSPQATHTAPEDARWRSRCNFCVLQHWSCATIIAQFYRMLHNTDGGKLASTLWLSWNGVSYMSTWGTDRVVSWAFNPSNPFLLGAGVVFASALLWHISRCFHLDGSVYDFRFIVPLYPTSSGDADGKLSMTIKMFASYIRRNDFTLPTYFTIQVFP